MGVRCGIDSRSQVENWSTLFVVVAKRVGPGQDGLGSRRSRAQGRGLGPVAISICSAGAGAVLGEARAGLSAWGRQQMMGVVDASCRSAGRAGRRKRWHNSGREAEVEEVGVPRRLDTGCRCGCGGGGGFAGTRRDGQGRSHQGKKGTGPIARRVSGLWVGGCGRQGRQAGNECGRNEGTKRKTLSGWRREGGTDGPRRWEVVDHGSARDGREREEDEKQRDGREGAQGE